jgi:hypothetical protein
VPSTRVSSVGNIFFVSGEVVAGCGLNVGTGDELQADKLRRIIAMSETSLNRKRMDVNFITLYSL